MPRQALAGSRIRERRTAAGLRQVDLARRVGISASYLNLIEHNRRNVGAALLRKIAEALKVDPAALTEGAGATLLAGLREAATSTVAAGTPAHDAPELDRIEEFVGRFPGWAGLLARLQGRVGHLERSVEMLGDRLAHDPTLSAALHDILSAVTALRSTAAILAEDGEIEPEWRARFHANLEDESVRLAEGAGALVSYLDTPRRRELGAVPPQEAFEGWLEARGYHLVDCEGAACPDPEALAPELPAAARRLAATYARRYSEDAAALPMPELLAALAEVGPDPGILAQRFGLPLPLVFRRLAALPPGRGDGAEPDPGTPGRIGLVACDGSGALIFRKPAEGFVLPRFGSGCPLWPLYQALARPVTPIRVPLETVGRGQRRFHGYAYCQPSYPGGFGSPPVVEAWMLILPDDGPPTTPAQAVGSSCRICARSACPARREPSILGDEG
ncbi:hypothetical protein U879_07235 [Defluviimonas sp. 20V17]|uniref:XRE family transcriptional regulator n=1 Tax=Allgaiera indica TaxID=765699 RepID=A0AAN5A1A7_9RHOB|nr:helix-turn-helix transcriptional regulator [Allgaiera indica]KDB04360.1 hypothetical protein U879_07235 [Defluviimonas sp. 20V17]GHE06285.1 XRE family transcriptional regulator [Allgaiera indica]SDX89512.1 hypothetical protein SAMN05444006_1394 [Allgaiera indica]